MEKRSEQSCRETAARRRWRTTSGSATATAGRRGEEERAEDRDAFCRRGKPKHRTDPLYRHPPHPNPPPPPGARVHTASLSARLPDRDTTTPR
ncbi:unnamed protein product [Pleuronectes platessa]|uniref:Uncharacterized protein n=1 Tax=Pleuronectes platessa TaxID=8262 RepID=A0A9N7Z3U3_PLEPL|nr:unnamed protein product [Pleuronectes platessa]